MKIKFLIIENEMVSIQKNIVESLNHNFLMIGLGSGNFVLNTHHIDGIAEYSFDISELSNSDFFLGNYFKCDESIPIINIRKYLNCKNANFIHTPQSRILFVRDGGGIEIVGFGVNAILGFYRNLTELKVLKADLDSNPDLKCFQIEFKVIIEAKSVPILEIERLIDFSRLKRPIKPKS